MVAWLVLLLVTFADKVIGVCYQNTMEREGRKQAIRSEDLIHHKSVNCQLIDYHKNSWYWFEMK